MCAFAPARLTVCARLEWFHRLPQRFNRSLRCIAHKRRHPLQKAGAYLLRVFPLSRKLVRVRLSGILSACAFDETLLQKDVHRVAQGSLFDAIFLCGGFLKFKRGVFFCFGNHSDIGYFCLSAQRFELFRLQERCTYLRPRFTCLARFRTPIREFCFLCSAHQRGPILSSKLIWSRSEKSRALGFSRASSLSASIESPGGS